MVIAYTPGPFPFVIEEDLALPEDERTTFFLKNLSQEQWDKLIPTIAGREGEAINLMGAAATKICKLTLVNWENYRDAEGEEIPFEHGNMKANLNHLSAATRMKIAVEALNRNQLTENDEKN